MFAAKKQQHQQTAKRLGRSATAVGGYFVPLNTTETAEVACDDEVMENSYDEKRQLGVQRLLASDNGDMWRPANFSQTDDCGCSKMCTSNRRFLSQTDDQNVVFVRNPSPTKIHLHRIKPKPSSGQQQQLCRPSLSNFQLSVRSNANSCSLQNGVAPVNRLNLKTFRVAPPSNIGSLRFREGIVPLPNIGWAEPDMVWNLICWKDTVYCRNPHLLQNHPSLQPKMRAILIDWLCEVSEVYKLHRETFYLAIDFVDRYLSKEKHVEKDCLQLIGVTALFIAAKIEEIYPPKCADFAYITDGACSADEISRMELCILKSLNWALAPITAIHWLTIYLQLIDQQENRSIFDLQNRKSRDLTVACYHRYHFIHLAQLVDLCIMDIGSLQFPYSVLAACAFAHILEPDYLALHVSGFKHDHIAMCYNWMQPFARAVLERGEIQIKHFYDIANDDLHNIQTHVVDMELLERAQTIQQEMQKASRMSPVFLQDSLNILPTPPPSEERPAIFASRCPPFALRP